MFNKFKQDVIKGLSKSPQKTLPSKYFYDKKGDELFVKIMALPEYYLTRAEMEIFKNKTEELISALYLNKKEKYDIIELGAGDGTKTIHLLKKLISLEFDFEYIPVDISKNALEGLNTYLKNELPDIVVKPNHTDYFKALNDLKQDGRTKIILFLGSNIGNLLDEQATDFIYHLGSSLYKGDKIILGVDLKKSKEIVLPAYNDSQKITAEFNLNLLDRINNELGANFDRNNFEHYPDYDEEIGIAKSYIKSLKEQWVKLDEQWFHFIKDELIHTEVSRKYDDEIIKQILSKTDITWEYKIMDSKNLFADYILHRN
ncbi:MAG: L-histidine N(alpha)-methyltransferase [Chitinophagaceae bacterium]|jgi:dimethylhistidine N-methyltransferase|nr:L-histidine N(alpha)-methyltransferase [Chitinophagaceae bacterium]